ncbi:hypothetical protein Cadr_000012102 [Camelus dromedarius]|uniref:Uncharacterized protein n=1 Tax=Camelus dromedarius TaxID=9838 RepID=A0A5N4DVN1_CAMDR|nr:hypothetical protein Cadr_000012102 [Camelus dromedarius]
MTCSNILSLPCPAGPIALSFQEKQDKLDLTKPMKTTFTPGVPTTWELPASTAALESPATLSSRTDSEPRSLLSSRSPLKPRLSLSLAVY